MGKVNMEFMHMQIKIIMHVHLTRYRSKDTQSVPSVAFARSIIHNVDSLRIQQLLTGILNVLSHFFLLYLQNIECLPVSQYDINKVTNIIFSCPFDNIVVYIIRSMINVECRVSNKHAMQPPTNNSDLTVPPGDLQFIQLVGAGGYGEVWKGKWRGKGGGITVAIKKVPVNKLNPRQQREILVEVGIFILSVSFSFSFLHISFMFYCCPFLMHVHLLSF